MFKLFLDPGHGGSDSGAVGNGLREKDLTLVISNKIRDILANEYDGVAVNMSRTGDTFPTLQQRTNEANNWGADYFLSIHINSAANNSATGFESFVDTGVGAATKNYQNIVHDEIMKEIGLRDRGKKQARFHVIHASRMPAILTESGFINNPSDAAKMKDNTWLDKVARGHVNGLAKAFNLKRKTATSSPSSDQTTPSQEAVQVARDINVVSEWAKKDWEESVANGYFDGTRPGALITREEMALVINRLRRNLLEEK